MTFKANIACDTVIWIFAHGISLSSLRRYSSDTWSKCFKSVDLFH